MASTRSRRAFIRYGAAALLPPLDAISKERSLAAGCNLITQTPGFRQRFRRATPGAPFLQEGGVMFRTGIRSTRPIFTHPTLRSSLAVIALAAATAMALATGSALAAPPK